MSVDPSIDSSSTSPTESRVCKETLLTAYAATAGVDSREFIGAVVGDHVDVDPFAKRDVERRTTKVGFDITLPLGDDHFDDELELSASNTIYSSKADTVKGALTNGDLELGEHLEFTDETSTSIEHQHSTTSLAKSFVEDVFAGFEPVDGYHESDGFKTLSFTKDVVNAVGEKEELHAELDGPYNSHIGKQKILKMQPERSAQARFETDADGEPIERQAVQFQFAVEGTDADDVDEMTERFITTLRDQLSNKSAVGRLRLTDCQKTTIESGDCHNL